MGKRIRFGVLGPLQVSVDGGDVAVSGARQRVILALLLLARGRIVPVDSLVDAVWYGRPPATARTQVAICVAALRKSFRAEGVETETIVTAHPGYRIAAENCALDLEEFTVLTSRAKEAVRDGRPVDAAHAYAKALALWTGPVLAGVPARPVEDEAVRLSEVRLNTYDDANAVQLELGAHQEIVPDLAAMVNEHPLRERTRGHLMLAQYRSGRRADAMETYREARRRFIDELGMEPGPELRALHDAILNDDPGLGGPPATEHRPEGGHNRSGGPEVREDRDGRDPGQDSRVDGQDGRDSRDGRGSRDSRDGRGSRDASGAPPDGTGGQEHPDRHKHAGAALRAHTVPSECPPDVAGFTGRAAELAALDSLVETAAERPVATLGVVTGAVGAGKTGLAVRWAHRVADRFPDGQLFADLHGYDDHEPSDNTTDTLGRFLRSLGVPSEQIPPETEARVALYRSVLSDRRVLVLLDNVRKVDQVRALLPGGSGCCTVLTSREQLVELVSWPPRARVALGVLTEDESVALLATIVGEARIAGAPSEVTALVGLCDRLPLALRIVGARLASKPHWTVGHMVRRLSDERRRLDELSQGGSKVRASLEFSYRCLPEDAARLFRRLGLLAVPDVTCWTAAALLDTGLLDAERLVEDLVDAHFLEVVGQDATGTLRYRLPNLLRLYADERAAEEEEPPECHAARDRFFRSCLTLAEEAHRREYGGDFSVLHGTVERRPVDPGLTEELLAAPLEWFEAERLSLRAVVEQSAGAGMAELAWDLCMSMVSLFEIRNYVEDWRFCCERALEACAETGNRRGQAAMLHDMGAIELRLRRLERAEKHFGQALALHDQLGEEHGRALTLRNMAIVARMRGELDQALAWLEEARDIFHRCGDLSSKAHTMNNMAQIALDSGSPSEAVERGLEAVRISESIGAGGLRGVAQASHRLARAYLAQGELVRAEEEFSRVLHIVEEKADMVGLAHALLGLGETHLASGAWQRAEETLEDALELAARIHSPVVEGQICLALAEVLRHRGRDEPARRRLLLAQERFTEAGVRPLRERAAEALRDFPTGPS